MQYVIAVVDVLAYSSGMTSTDVITYSRDNNHHLNQVIIARN